VGVGDSLRATTCCTWSQPAHQPANSASAASNRPPSDYALTEIGAQLKPAMRPLLDWSLARQQELLQGS
jgi:hypothetical protein